MTVSEESPLKFEDEHISVQVVRRPHSRVEFDMHASTGIVQAAYDDALTEVTKEVTLPGFRKGKAPKGLVQKQYLSQIDHRWQDKIASRAMREGERLTKISPLFRSSQITYSIRKHDLESGADLSITFEADPVIPTVIPTELTIHPVDRRTVDAKMIDETIRQMRFFFAEWETVTDEVVAKGNIVVLDVENLATEPPEQVFIETRFEVEDKKMAQWMLNAILGKRLHDVVEAISLPDDDVSEETKAAYVPQNTRITIKGIQRAQLPEIDDHFANKLGVKSVSDLYEQVSRRLNEQADEAVREQLRTQISEELLKKYPLDMPHSLIDQESKFRLRHLFEDAEFQKEWSGWDHIKRQEFVSSIVEHARKAVSLFYLCQKVLADANLTVDGKDPSSVVNSPLDALLQKQPAPLQGAANEIQQAEAFSRLLLEKAEDYLIANATMC
jgi:trigger factor